MLTDRKAADRRAREAVNKAHQVMTRHRQANGGNPAMAFRNGLREAEGELPPRLIEIYAKLAVVNDDATQDELVAEVIRRITSFIQSSLDSEGGSKSAAFEAVKAINRATMGIKGAFEFAVHEQEEAMSSPFSRLANEEITLVKPDGLEHNGLPIYVALESVDVRQEVSDWAPWSETDARRAALAGTVRVRRQARPQHEGLTWDGRGIVVVHKKLDAGRFELPRAAQRRRRLGLKQDEWHRRVVDH